MNSPSHPFTRSARGFLCRCAVVVAVLAVHMLAATAGGRKTIPLSELPVPVASTLTEVASGIHITESESRGTWKKFYEFEGTLGGAELEIKIGADGTLLAIEYESRHRPQTVPTEELPSAVVATISSAYPDLRIRDIELTRVDDLDLYQVIGIYKARRISFYISGMGTLIGQSADSDGDGLPDSRESDFGCDPMDADSDDDMFPDGFETQNGTDPMNSAISPEILKIGILREEHRSRNAVVLSVSTFQGGLFSIEHCPNARDWTSLDISIAGDNQTHEVIVPVEDSLDCGYFRVTISDLATVKDTPVGGGIGTTSSEFTPSRLEGTKFDVNFGEENGKDLIFDSGGRGQLVERIGRRIEVEPFTYRYVRTGKSTAKVIVRFPRAGEDLIVEYELEFTADGKGTIVRSGPQGEASGDFSYRNRSDRANKV